MHVVNQYLLWQRLLEEIRIAHGNQIVHSRAVHSFVGGTRYPHPPTNQSQGQRRLAISKVQRWPTKWTTMTNRPLSKVHNQAKKKRTRPTNSRHNTTKNKLQTKKKRTQPTKVRHNTAKKKIQLRNKQRMSTFVSYKPKEKQALGTIWHYPSNGETYT